MNALAPNQRLISLAAGVVQEFPAEDVVYAAAKALEVVNDVAHPAGGILIDSLHLQRTGSSVQDIVELSRRKPESTSQADTRLLPYFQLCDASKNLEDQSIEGILEDALFLRQLLGDGQLPLKETLEAVGPNMPLSLEIRSRALIEQYPNLQDRANAVFSSSIQ